MNWLFYLVPAAAVVALLFAWIFFRQMFKESEGTPTMKEIAQYVREGAMAYLRQQYKVVVIVFIVLAIFFAILAYGFGVQNPWVPFAFLTGGFFSGLAGFVGMKTATYASARTANATMRSLNSGLKIAFRSGAVMGLTVVGLGLLDISLWWIILNAFVEEATPAQTLVVITTTMLTFGMGASTQALFARVGGGIYTKAADVGADIVGKVEQDIPEDDPRNPATIADNVGDNVGDVAGMGADLYESYCGSILATMALGASAFFSQGTEIQMKAILAPMVIAAIGVVLSVLGIYAVRTKEGANLKDLLGSLSVGTNLSAILIAIMSFGVFYMLGFNGEQGLPQWWQLSLSVLSGLGAGVIVGKVTEFYTSHSYRPTRKLASSAQTGSATVVINGVGLGMRSTAIPVITIAIAILLAYGFATGFVFSTATLSLGLYGISIAAVGMLSTLGITLATDAYGPIADNAGGNAQMSELDPSVREKTDVLDSLGNTTAATGKGFAIGSAALTALALLASYIEELKIGFSHIGKTVLQIGDRTVDTLTASITDIVEYYDITLMNPMVLVGVFIGSMMAFLFCGLTMNAVGRAASKMVVEVRRQFREIKGILEGKQRPDYTSCVRISTKAAQQEMILPSVLAIVIPMLVGVILGPAGVIGLLAGGLGAGFVLAIFLANSGGAWDNAKKYVEEGNFGGKNSPAHKATIVGDTVGDPFKDTSGPSLNILIKLMSMVSIVMAGLTVMLH
ncbi:MAG: sodium-translocating pyrophosphatase [Bacteroidales bacterium]|jgi:K(+)-stimulated pyrophosphate-energized sodium pump|nr:sodium-translocating pyrophosphatase [Bacteroidales bacterium]